MTAEAGEDPQSGLSAHLVNLEADGSAFPDQPAEGGDIDETPAETLFRELRLEHTQIRELSGMMRRLVEQAGDLAGARRLFGNFARRWDAHTEKEERALAGG